MKKYGLLHASAKTAPKILEEIEGIEEDQLEDLVDARRTQLVMDVSRRYTNLVRPKQGQEDVIKLVETDN